MIPRPIYKFMAVPLWFFFITGIWWLWSIFAAEPQQYYVGLHSLFFYERLFLPELPSMPKLPWSHADGLPVPEHYTTLGYPCPQGTCLATPASVAAGYPQLPFTNYVSRALLRSQLTEYVFGGGLIVTFLLSLSLLSLPAIFCTAAVMDFLRYRRLMRDGVQLAGRREVRPQEFEGVLARLYWWKKRNVVLAVEPPSND